MKTRQELEFFLAADRFARGEDAKKARPALLGDEVWKFQIALRKCEYYRARTGLARLAYLAWKLRKRHLGIKLGLDIPEGVFGAGLRINHFGCIVVNSQSAVGRWCDIHQGVNIGAGNPARRVPGERYSPNVGDHVWIGPGAKLFGAIRIGDRVQIGANAVVGRSCESDVTLAGAPARVVREEGTGGIDVASNPEVARAFFDRHPQYRDFDTTR